MHLAGNPGLLFFAHAFKVRRQLTQLTAGTVQLQLDAFTVADVPDDAIPHHCAVAKTSAYRFDLSPALLTLTSQNPPLPRPVTVTVQRYVLHAMVIRLVMRMHQTAQPHLTLTQRRWRIARQVFAAFADIRKIQFAGQQRTLQTEHQPRNIGRDPLQAGIAFLQSRLDTAPLCHVIEVHHQVLRILEAQKAQGHVGRKLTAIGTHALRFDALNSDVIGARAAP